MLFMVFISSGLNPGMGSGIAGLFDDPPGVVVPDEDIDLLKAVNGRYELHKRRLEACHLRVMPVCLQQQDQTVGGEQGLPPRASQMLQPASAKVQNPCPR